jgi:competence ComEA-like helix-hairpin-helix protein
MWRTLLESTWFKPACKFLGLLVLLTALSWIGSRQSVFGWNLAARAPGSMMLSSITAPAAPAMPVAAADAALSDAGNGPSVEAATTSAPGVLPDGRIVLNTANEDELRKLPRVGQKRAAAIVALRQRMGRFRSVRDLLRVKGLGLRTLQKLQPMVVLDAPSDAGSGE